MDQISTFSSIEILPLTVTVTVTTESHILGGHSANNFLLSLKKIKTRM